MSERQSTKVTRGGGLGGLILGIVVFFASRDDAAMGWLVMGIGGPAGIVAGLTSVGVLFVLGRQPVTSLARVPLSLLACALPMLLAFLPYAVGLLATFSAVASSSALLHDLLLAVGTAESTMSLAFGASLTFGLSLRLLVSVGAEGSATGESLRTGAACASVAMLAVFGLGVATVLGSWSDGLIGAHIAGTARPADIVAVVDLSRVATMAWAAATVLLGIAAVGMTVSAPARSDSGGALTTGSIPSGLIAASAVTVVLAFSGAAFVATRAVNAHRSDLYTQHLDSFAPIAAGPADHTEADEVVVVVPGMIVDASRARRLPLDMENLERVASIAPLPAFALDTRISPRSLRELVVALENAHVPRAVLLGVAHESAALEEVRTLARVPYFGLPLPLASSLALELAVNAPDAPSGSCRVLVAHGTPPSFTDPAGAATGPSTGPVSIVLTESTTVDDLVNAIRFTVAAEGHPFVVSSAERLPVAPTADASAGLGMGGGIGGLAALGLDELSPELRATIAAAEAQALAAAQAAGSPATGMLEGLFGRTAAAGAGANDAPPPTVPEGIDPAVITRVLRALSPRVRRCYEQGLRQDPALTGRANARLAIGETGAMTSVVVTSDTLPTTVARCMEQVLAAATMPAPGLGQSVTVNFPFVFASGN